MFGRKKKDSSDNDENKKASLFLKVFVGIIIFTLVLLIIPEEWFVKKAAQLEQPSNTIEDVINTPPLSGSVTLGQIVERYSMLRAERSVPLFELSSDLVTKAIVGEPSTVGIDYSSLSRNFVYDLNIPNAVTGVEPIYSDEYTELNAYEELDAGAFLAFYDLTVEEILDTDLVKFRLTGTDNVLYVKFLVSESYYYIGDTTTLTVPKALYSASKTEGYAFYIGGVI